MYKDRKDVTLMHVYEVMSTSLVTAAAAATRMYLKGVKKLVVIDGRENLIGIITQTDVATILKSDIFKSQL